MFCVFASVHFTPSTKETAVFLWAYRAPTCAKPFSTSSYLDEQTEHYQPTLSISPNNGHNWIVLQAVQPLWLILFNGCAIHTHRKFSHHRIFSNVRTRTTFSTHRSTVRSNQCRSRTEILRYFMNESSHCSDSISIIYNGYDCSSTVKNSSDPLPQLTCIFPDANHYKHFSHTYLHWYYYIQIDSQHLILSTKANQAQSKSALVKLWFPLLLLLTIFYSGKSTR